MPEPPPPVIDYTVHLTERARGFTGRGWVLQQLDDWLADPAGGRYFVLTGEPGSGKTALAARLAQLTNGTVQAPAGLRRIGPGFLGAVHFCSVRDLRWINPRVFAESLTKQLSDRFDDYAAAVLRSVAPTVNLQLEVRQNWGRVIGAEIGTLVVNATPEDLFDRLVREPLEAIGRDLPPRRQPNGDLAPGQVVVLVDALDESLTYNRQVKIADLLLQAAELPPAVRFILTSRPDVKLLRDLRLADARILSLSPRRSEAGPVLRDVQEYLEQTIATGEQPLRDNLAPDLPVADFVSTVRDRSEGNFLYVRHLLLALTARPGPISAQDLADLPAGLDQIYLQFLQRLAGHDVEAWQAKYGKMLGVLAVAQVPLVQERIEAFTKLPSDVAGPALARVRQLLETDEQLPASERAYALYHRSFAEFLLSRDRAEEYSLDSAAMHRLIALYYWDTFRGDWLNTPKYGLRNLATHLFGAGDNDRLQQLIDDRWIAVRHRTRNYSYDGLLDDIELAWKSATAHNRHQLAHGLAPEVGQEVRWALSLTSIGSMVRDIAPEVLAALVGNGVWSHGQGLAYARRTPAGEPRTKSLAMLAPHLASADETFQEALATAGLIIEADERAATLTWLLPRLPGSLRRQGFERALEAVAELSDQRRVAGGYSAYYGSGEGERFEETGARTKAQEQLADALLDLLDPPLAKASIVAELQGEDPAGLSPRLTARSLELPWPMAAAPDTESLLGLVDILPEIGDRLMLEEVKTTYRVARRYQPPPVPEPSPPTVRVYGDHWNPIAQQLARAKQVQDPDERAARISAIAVPAIDSANVAYYGRGYPGWNTRHRIMLLSTLLAHLPEPHATAAGRCLLDRIEEYADPVSEQDTAVIAWYLPDSLLAEATAAITEVPLPLLMPSSRLPLALRVARERRNKEWLLATASRLTDPLLLEALEAARELGGSELQAELFARCAQNFAVLDRDVLYEAWTVTLQGMVELHRPVFLDLLLRQQPVVAALGGEASLRSVLLAVEDVGKWWP